MTARWVISRAGFVLGAALGLAFIASWTLLLDGGNAYDLHAYWVVNPVAPYAHQGLVGDAFQYTPAAAWVGVVIHLLPFGLVAVLWRLSQLGVILAAAGPFSVLVLLTVPVASELNLGNINIFLGAAVVVGFQSPAAWALILLTKPTAGIALLWFVARRDWRSLRIAIGVTLILSAISFVLTPQAWFDYFAYMLSRPAPSVQGWPVLWVRLPFAALVAILGGLRGWRWTALVAAWLALPVWWDVSPSMLVAGLAFMWRSPLLGRNPARWPVLWRRIPGPPPPPAGKEQTEARA